MGGSFGAFLSEFALDIPPQDASESLAPRLVRSIVLEKAHALDAALQRFYKESTTLPTHIAYCAGPGRFMGIRTAASLATGLAAGLCFGATPWGERPCGACLERFSQRG